LKHWLACDVNRLGTYMPPAGIIAIELKNTYWKPCFTSLQAETVLRILKEKNENIVRDDWVRNGFRMVPAPVQNDGDNGFQDDS
jgi:hypothetical protein